MGGPATLGGDRRRLPESIQVGRRGRQQTVGACRIRHPASVELAYNDAMHPRRGPAMITLKDARIWVSGSIPDEASTADRQRIRDFLLAFAKEVFRRNGTVV